MANQYTIRGGLTRPDVERAMRNSKSNKGAARYLGVSLPTYKKYAKLYIDDQTGKSLYDLHSNMSGIGISKHHIMTERSAIMDIVEGKVPVTSYTTYQLKDRLINEGLLQEKCACCNFEERRVLDYKMPLMLVFLDGNKKNWKLDNLQLLCYNCFFLRIGDIYTKKQIETIEGYNKKNHSKMDQVFQMDWDKYDVLMKYHKEGGGFDKKEPHGPQEEDDNSGEDLISRYR